MIVIGGVERIIYTPDAPAMPVLDWRCSASALPVLDFKRC